MFLASILRIQTKEMKLFEGVFAYLCNYFAQEKLWVAQYRRLSGGKTLYQCLLGCITSNPWFS